MKKKILFMVTTMDVGGVEKSLLSLLSVLPKAKYDVTVLFLDKQGDLLQAIPDWVKVEEVNWYENVWANIITPPPQILRNYLDGKNYIKAFSFGFTYFLSRELNNRYLYYKHIFKRVPKNPTKYDIAIAFQGPTDMIDYYIAYKVDAKQKISWIHFDVSEHYIDKNLYERLYKSFDKIFVVSNEARKQLIAKIPELEGKTEVLMNIVSKRFITKMANETVEFDESYQGIRIVTVGRLAMEKGQDIAIKTLSRLRKDGYDVKWYCIGDGEHRGKYKDVINEFNLNSEFILLGSKLNPYPYIAQSDIYVQPSRHDGYCIALAEAKCLNKPIVATNFIGAYEQIINGENGWIVSTSQDALYKKIKFLIDHPNQQAKLIENLSKTEIDTTSEVDKLINYIKV
ncbi:glycosyltransferase [Lentibacillus sp. Marseille-P4043]|uniref:glycosyltransferase n=1 Tax=Lentibacillus sp. Marseille-P4043 TaxID=2040293 RepID=UPI001F227B84|nr:glycosyltransferase [Lentibacillus sp. Marseille-P4043]